jgi:hypothetical protein
VERLTGDNGITDYAAGNLLVDVDAITGSCWPTTKIITAARIGPCRLEALPAIVRVVGERASRCFIEFFTAAICNRNTRLAYMRGKTVLRLVRRPAG